MPNTQSCPSVEQLKQLAVGLLPDPPAGSLEEHLLECDACVQQTAQFQQTDTLISAIKNAGLVHAEQSPDELARLERLMTSLSGLRGAPSDATILSNPLRSQAATNLADDVTRELSSVWRAPERDDELGRIGGYRILKVLGVGGMGGVFLAEDIQLQRRVALKLMRPRTAATAGAAERFLREARAAAALRHDHIITIYQVGEEAGVPFLAMEFLEGESLDDRLKRESLPPVADVLRIGREIAEGLAAAHAKGLIHRDIKPANVWLEGIVAERSRHAPRDEPNAPSTANDQTTSIDHSAHHAERDGYVDAYFRVKLLDFGLARSAEADTHLTASGMIIGTPSYMAPEQASGETIDARVDLFSLGVVLYRMTTGQLPFPGKNVMEILRSLVTVTPAAPQSLNPAVPSELSDLIVRLLAKDRAVRPASAREVVKSLALIARTFDEPVTRMTGTPARLPVDLSDIATVCEEPLSEQQSGEPCRVNPRTHKAATQVRGLTPPGSPKIRAVALAAVSAVLLLGAVLFVQTRGGTLKIEAGDGIDASVVKEQVAIRDTVSGKTYEVSVGENSMRPGQYEIVLRDPTSGLKISTERVEIQRGNSTPLRITLQADAVVAGLRPSLDGATAGLPGSKPVPNPGDLRSGKVARSETSHNKPGDNDAAKFITLVALNPTQIPESERFDWQPEELVAVIGEHRLRHWAPVHQVRFHPSGEFFVTVDDNNTPKLTLTKSLESPPVNVALSISGVGFEFSRDGKWMYSGNRIYSVNMTDAANPRIELAHTLPTDKAVFSSDVAVHDNRWLILATDAPGELLVWDVAAPPPGRSRPSSMKQNSE